jgi:hypothetical protein
MNVQCPNVSLFESCGVAGASRTEILCKQKRTNTNSLQLVSNHCGSHFPPPPTGVASWVLAVLVEGLV